MGTEALRTETESHILDIDGIRCTPERLNQGVKILQGWVRRRVIERSLGGNVLNEAGKPVKNEGLENSIDAWGSLLQKIFFTDEPLSNEEVEGIFTLVKNDSILLRIRELFDELSAHNQRNTRPYDDSGKEISTQGIVSGDIANQKFLSKIKDRLRYNQGFIKWVKENPMHNRVGNQTIIEPFLHTPVGIYTTSGIFLETDSRSPINYHKSGAIIIEGSLLYILSLDNNKPIQYFRHDGAEVGIKFVNNDGGLQNVDLYFGDSKNVVEVYAARRLLGILKSNGYIYKSGVREKLLGREKKIGELRY